MESTRIEPAVDTSAFMDALDRVNRTENGLPYSLTKEKRQAIRAAACLFPDTVRRIFVVGGKGYETDALEAMGFGVSHGQLEDGFEMHTSPAPEGAPFDGIFCRHVLEHSPFPLYALMRFHGWLVEGGHIVAVVPKPETPFVMDHPSHVSVLPKPVWRRVFGMAGFAVVQEEDGTWTKDGHVEHRFLLEKL